VFAHRPLQRLQENHWLCQWKKELSLWTTNGVVTTDHATKIADFFAKALKVFM